MKRTPKVKKIEPLDSYKIKIIHESGTKIIDIADSDLLTRFPKLSAKDYFDQVKLSGGSLKWPDGLQLDLDELVYDWPNATTKYEGVASYSERINSHY